MRTPEKIERVKKLFKKSRTKSCRILALYIEISNSTVQRIKKYQLKIHPHKIMITHRLRPNSFERRLSLRLEIQQKVYALASVFVTDEAHFHLNATVKKQNFRDWSNGRPCHILEITLHTSRFTV